MSLEQALADNTAAIRELVAVWSKLSATAGKIDAVKQPGDTITAGGTPVATVKADKPKAESKPEVKKETAEAPKPVAESSAPATTDAPAASSVDYPTLQKAVFALAGKSREAAAAVAASFGVKTFKELDAEKWGEALGAVQEKLAELEQA